MNPVDFKGRVAIVTGAGGGVGRLHALGLAERGARVVVNDLGGAVDGTGGSASAAQKVVEEIRARGGEAIASGASVTDFAAVQAMVQQAMDTFDNVTALPSVLEEPAHTTFHDFRKVVRYGMHVANP